MISLIDGRYAPVALLRTSDGRHAILARAVKAVDPRESDERRLYRALLSLFREQAPLTAAKLERGELPSETEMEAALSAVLRPELAQTAAGEFGRLAAQIGVQFDVAEVSKEMLDWSRSYTYDLVQGIDDTTRGVLRTALSEFQATPGMTRGALEALISPAFSPERAEMIASTEVTRSYQHAMDTYQADVRQYGIEMEQVYHTAADELVCEVCGPDNGKPESEWTAGGKPPRHPRCRCSTTLRRKREVAVPFRDELRAILGPSLPGQLRPGERQATGAELDAISVAAAKMPAAFQSIARQRSMPLQVAIREDAKYYGSGRMSGITLSADVVDNAFVVQHELRHALVAPQVISQQGGRYQLLDELAASKVRMPIHANYAAQLNRGDTYWKVDEYITMMGDWYKNNQTLAAQVKAIMAETHYTVYVEPVAGIGHIAVQGAQRWTEAEAEVAVSIWRKWMGIPE